MTNGGGVSESAKALDLNSKFQADLEKHASADTSTGTIEPIFASQILLSHTPFQGLPQALKDRKALILGHAGCLDIARSYGFKQPFSPHQVYSSVRLRVYV
jgi:hypothetical protein